MKAARPNYCFSQFLKEMRLNACHRMLLGRSVSQHCSSNLLLASGHPSSSSTNDNINFHRKLWITSSMNVSIIRSASNNLIYKLQQATSRCSYEPLSQTAVQSYRIKKASNILINKPPQLISTFKFINSSHFEKSWRPKTLRSVSSSDVLSKITWHHIWSLHRSEISQVSRITCLLFRNEISSPRVERLTSIYYFEAS